MNRPLVSIITVNYNHKEGLERTILNVLDQNGANFEFLVIDGGSDDGSEKLIDTYKDGIDYWVSEKDKGIYDAMNKGIKASKGKWLIFMNSDDCFYQKDTLIKAKLESLEDEAVVFGDTWRRGSQEVSISQLNKKAGNRILDACHQSVFFNKDVLQNELYYDQSLQLAGDTELLTRIFLKNYSFKKIDLVVADYAPGGLSSGGGISNEMLWKNRKAKYLRTYRNFGVKGILNDFILFIKHKLGAK